MARGRRINAKARAKRVQAALADRGVTCAMLDRRHGFSPRTASNALFEPHEAAERAIAEVLGQHPMLIWPERYDPTGLRLTPQPRANYRARGLTLASGRDAVA